MKKGESLHSGSRDIRVHPVIFVFPGNEAAGAIHPGKRDRFPAGTPIMHVRITVRAPRQSLHWVRPMS